jgi:hypothetical protein
MLLVLIGNRMIPRTPNANPDSPPDNTIEVVLSEEECNGVSIGREIEERSVVVIVNP